SRWLHQLESRQMLSTFGKFPRVGKGGSYLNLRASFPKIRADGSLGMDNSLYTVAVPIVFDQEIDVHYGQFYVQSRPDFFVGLIESLGGQANGLCGAAVPGLLFLITGLHTFHTSVTVEMLGAPAPIGEDWEDVVEASFRPATAKVALVQWAGEA